MSGHRRRSPVSIIVVEDERDLLEEIVSHLSDHGMTVRGVTDGPDFWRCFGELEPDIVVLDLGLAREDGSSIAAAVRERAPDVGVIMTTARGAIQDRIGGYEAGADIYLVKPVDLGELSAAIRSLRRRRTQSGTEESGEERPIPRWELDLLAWRLTAPNKQQISLTRVESELLECLTLAPGQPVTRFDLARHMGKSEQLLSHRFIDQAVHRLRQKIETKIGLDAPVGSAHGRGYLFTQPAVQKNNPK